MSFLSQERLQEEDVLDANQAFSLGHLMSEMPFLYLSGDIPGTFVDIDMELTEVRARGKYLRLRGMRWC